MENYTSETNGFENSENERRIPVEIVSNKKETKPQWMSIVSFILSIVSYFVCCFGFLPALLAVVFGVIAITKGQKDAMSVTGLVLGAIYIVLFGLVICALLTAGDVFVTHPGFDSFRDFDYYF